MTSRSRAPWDVGVSTLKNPILPGEEHFSVVVEGDPSHIVAITGRVGAPNETTCIADAMLLAAAPDLFSALEETLQHLEYLAPEKFDDAEHEASFGAVIARARAAIEKAG